MSSKSYALEKYNEVSRNLKEQVKEADAPTQSVILAHLGKEISALENNRTGKEEFKKKSSSVQSSP